MATDATGTPTSLGVPTYNTSVDAPSGLGFNAAMASIDALLVAAMRIQKGGSSVANRRAFNLIETNSLMIAVADDAGNGRVNATFTASTPIINIKAPPYNAVGDGIADDTAAIQNAINDLPSGAADGSGLAGAGGIIWFPNGTYKITSTLNINKSNVTLWGAGSEGFRNTQYGTEASCQIKWAGASGGTMISQQPVSGTARKTVGGGIQGIHINSNNALAGYGLVLRSHMMGYYRDLSFTAFQNAALYGNVVASLTGAGEGRDCMYNDFVNVSFRTVNTADGAGAAVQITGDLSALGGGWAQASDWTFTNMYITHYNNPGVLLQSTTGNIFTNSKVFLANNGAGVAIIFDGSDQYGIQAIHNEFNGLKMATSSNAVPPSIWAKGAESGYMFGSERNVIRRLAAQGFWPIIRRDNGADLDVEYTDGRRPIFRPIRMLNAHQGTLNAGTPAQVTITTPYCAPFEASAVVGGATTTVTGDQTVGAGGNLVVGSTTGFTGTGNIIVAGTSYAYTAVVDATHLTLTVGGTFLNLQAVGQAIVIGVAGDLTVDDASEFSINGGTLVNDGAHFTFSQRTSATQVRISAGGTFGAGTTIWGPRDALILITPTSTGATAANLWYDTYPARTTVTGNQTITGGVPTDLLVGDTTKFPTSGIFYVNDIRYSFTKTDGTHLNVNPPVTTTFYDSHIVHGSRFTVTSSLNGDGRTFNWFIVDPAHQDR